MDTSMCDKGCGVSKRRDEALPRVWVLVTDPRRARIYRRDDSGDIRLVDQIRNDNPESRQHSRPPVDASYVRSMARWLGDFAEADAFDRFVLIGSPKILPRLRDGLDDIVQARMMAQIDEEVGHLDEQELRQKLGELMHI